MKNYSIIKKGIRLFVTILCLFASFSITNVNALSSKSDNSDSIIAGFANDLYHELNNTDIVNQEGVSVKEQFIVDTLDYFKDKDYSSIEDYCAENDLSFIRINVVNPRLSYTQNIHKDQTYSFKSNNITVTYTVRISGSVHVNDATGVITSYSGPTVAVIDCSLSSLLASTQLQNVSSNAKLSSTKRSITMTSSFNFTATGSASYYPLIFNDTRRTLSVSY